MVGDFGILQAIAPTRDEEARAKRASDIQGQIQQLQKMLEDAEAATKRTDLRAGKEETDRIRARFFGPHDGMEKAYADAKKDVERLQKQLLEPDKPLTKAQAQDLGQQLHVAEATEARRKAALDAVAKGAILPFAERQPWRGPCLRWNVAWVAKRSFQIEVPGDNRRP